VLGGLRLSRSFYGFKVHLSAKRLCPIEKYRHVKVLINRGGEPPWLDT